ncbi:MAG: hypothetical protein HXY46_03650 [Syntrophaceae bacterium]|nr:hypothetical protein [Syntrophaceae bacterium]
MGIITQKDYETYLSKLPDVSDKLYNPGEELMVNVEEGESKKEEQSEGKKKGAKKRSKGKGK